VKRFLWCGNVDAALECIVSTMFGLGLLRKSSTVAARIQRSATEFDTYVRNNRKYIPNFGEWYRQRDTISTAFVESTVNQVASRRFVKKQQMQWTPNGTHLLLQTRTRVLDGGLDTVFRGASPAFRPEPARPLIF